jgi:hypothetical protein
MKTEMITGVWTGIARNNNGWEMEITISIPAPFQAGDPLGTYNIPTIPCSGTFRVLRMIGETLELQAEDQQGDCGPADLDSLTLQADGTLLYLSKGDGWETRGTLQRIENP